MPLQALEPLRVLNFESLLARHALTPPLAITLEITSLVWIALLFRTHPTLRPLRPAATFLALGLSTRALGINLTLALAQSFEWQAWRMPRLIFAPFALIGASLWIVGALRLRSGKPSIRIGFVSCLTVGAFIGLSAFVDGRSGEWEVWRFTVPILWILGCILAFRALPHRDLRACLVLLGLYFTADFAGARFLEWRSGFGPQFTLTWEQILQHVDGLSPKFQNEGFAVIHFPPEITIYFSALAAVTWVATSGMVVWRLAHANVSERVRYFRLSIAMVSVIVVAFVGFAFNGSAYNAAIRFGVATSAHRLNALASWLNQTLTPELAELADTRDPNHAMALLTEFIQRNSDLGRIVLFRREQNTRDYIWAAPGEPFDRLPRTVASFETEVVNSENGYWITPVRISDRVYAFTQVKIRNQPGGDLWLGCFQDLEVFYRYKRPLVRSSIVLINAVAALLLLGAIYDRYRQREIEARFGRQQAEEADRVKTEMLAILGHDLRTPLQAMMTYLGLLQRERPGPPSDTYLQSLQKQTLALHQLLQNLLHYSAAQMGVRARRQALSLAGLIQEVENTIAPLAENKGLRFSVGRPPQRAEWICSDAVKLRQILLNLLSNAVDYTREGAVTLEVRVEKDSNPNSQEFIRFVVGDTGPGLPEDRKDKPFRSPQSFGRVGSTVRGFGLGLPLVEKLSVGLGGGCRLARSDATGTVFEFWIPFEPSAPADQSSAPLLSGRRPGTPISRVLLVEDHPALRDAQVETLTGFDVDVFAAGTVAEALRLANRHELDAAVIDLQLSDGDGARVAEHLRAFSPKGKHVWLIALSAMEPQELQAHAISAGFDAWLTKPVDTETLREALGLPWVSTGPGESRPAVGVREDALEKCRAMRAAINQKDTATVARAAHYLLNSAIVLADPRMEDLARSAQIAAQSDPPPWQHIADKLHALEDRLSRRSQ